MSDLEPVFLDDGVRPVRTPSGPAQQHVGSVLLRMSDCVALVNLGMGPPGLEPSELTREAPRGGDGGARLMDSLSAYGISCRDVRVVLFTQLLPHHVGWIEIAGEPTFPRARYQFSATAWEHARSAAGSHASAAATLAQIVELGDRRAVVDRGPTLVPGVRAMPNTSGLPGELSYALPDGTTVYDAHGTHTPTIAYDRKTVSARAELMESS